MSELASIRGGQNLEFVLWLLKKRQAAEDMATFYANHNAEGPRREGGLSNQQWQGFRCTIADCKGCTQTARREADPPSSVC